jgi:RNA polymerase sigma-70 factor (ECF subfamily)
MNSDQFIQELQVHQKIIFKVCSLYCKDAEDREDLFQEIVIQAWKSADRFRGESKFSTWLYQISLNAAISWFRKAKKRSNDVPFDRAKFGRESDDSWQTDERELQYQMMYRAIEQLSKIDKAIVTLYLEDYDYKAIGEMLGISANNVAVKMTRIRVSLKEIMEKMQ